MWNQLQHRTKIVATLGPASRDHAKLVELMQAGLDVCRLNASHGSHEEHQRMIDTIRAVNEEYNNRMSILFDLQGPKIRIGQMDEPYPISPGDVIELCTAIKQREGNRLPMELDTLAQDVKPNDQVLVEDGKVELRALTTNGKDTVSLLVVNGDEIGSRKGVNLPNSNISLPSMTDKDERDLEFAIKNEADWIALSFVRKAKDVRFLKEKLKARNCEARVIAKIEKPEALLNIDEIIEASDGIMVARGDLGVEIPIEEVPFWQKIIVAKCNEASKPVIVATQMLDSMIENKRPTRAEATDVANAVIDGADAVMLSGETSIGAYPVESVKTMRRIVDKAEQSDLVYDKNLQTDLDSETYLSDTTCAVACRFANRIGAKAIIGMTRSGYTAFQLSKHRPHARIYIFTDNKPLLYRLNLVWGVRAFYYTGFEGTDETISDVLEILKKNKIIQKGDIVVNTASMPMMERKRTNMIKYTIVD